MLTLLDSAFIKFLKDIENVENNLDVGNVEDVLNLLSEITTVRNLVLSKQIELFKKSGMQFPGCPNLAYQASTFWEEVGNIDKAFSEASRCIMLMRASDIYIPVYSRQYIVLALDVGSKSAASDELSIASQAMDANSFRDYFEKEISRLGQS